MNIPLWLSEYTYAIVHNPNCPKPYEVRLVTVGRLDFKHRHESKDAIGYGDTVTKAALEARNELTLFRMNIRQRLGLSS